MEIGDFSVLRTNPLLVMFLVLGLGVVLGRIRIAGIALGSVTGVLLVGLVAGYLDLPVPTSSHNVGFILFIYAVGVQAGPRFMSVFKRDGIRYGILAAVVAVTGTAIAGGLSLRLGFDVGVAAGILGGALTSTPTLVAAQDAVAQGVELPAGISQALVLENISSAYALSYVFGMAGLIIFVSVLPRLLKWDLVAEARAYGQEQGIEEGPSRARAERPTTHAYRVENPEAAGRSLGDERVYDLPGEFQKLKRGSEIIVPDAETVLEAGDIVSVVGLPSVQKRAREFLGPEVLDHDILDRTTDSRAVIVSHRAVVGKTLHEMSFASRYQAWLTRVTRGGMDLPRRPDLALQMGDTLYFAGARTNLDEVSELLGHDEARLQETDLVILAFGIGLGLLLGLPQVSIGDTTVGLGSAGGVLIAGLMMGVLHVRRPDLGRYPEPARNIIMELGMLFFMTGIAVSAGSGIVETFLTAGFPLMLTGIAVTVGSSVIALLVGRYVLRLNRAILFGAVTGAMTSTAALTQVTAQARSSVPMLGYVGAYAFANVFLTVAGALIMRL